MNPFHDVQSFHRLFWDEAPSAPRIPPEHVEQLWIDLVTEETDEPLRALRERDIVAIADGLADSIYVLCGVAIQYG